MSRNKDKYDSANRRQQIFLSQEDIAAGKKTNWSGLEITGGYHLIPKNIILILPYICLQAASAISARRCGNLSI